MTHDEILRQIAEMTEKLPDREFHRLMEFINAEYRSRLQRAAKLAALTLRPGDWVETTEEGRRLACGSRGRVLHLARSRVHVDFAEQGIWALLPDGIKKLEESHANLNEKDLHTSREGR